MKEISTFKGIPQTLATSAQSYTMSLARGAEDTGLVINGDEIHFQFEIEGLVLLVTHYDYYDGVNYWYYLINDENKIVDMASTPDYFGFLELKEQSRDEIKFSFFDSTEKWSLKIYPNGTWKVSLADLIRRSPKFWLSKKYIKLKRN